MVIPCFWLHKNNIFDTITLLFINNHLIIVFLMPKHVFLNDINNLWHLAGQWTWNITLLWSFYQHHQCHFGACYKWKFWTISNPFWISRIRGRKTEYTMQNIQWSVSMHWNLERGWHICTTVPELGFIVSILSCNVLHTLKYTYWGITC